MFKFDKILKLELPIKRKCFDFHQTLSYAPQNPSFASVEEKAKKAYRNIFIPIYKY